METYLVRVWLPDRPGVLGAVASRIGAVRGDVVGIDILERGGGRAIDELVVVLPDAALMPLLLSEINQVDGVDVEDVRAAPEHLHDPRLDALETAAALAAAPSSGALLELLVARARLNFEAEWSTAVDLDERLLLASDGPPPPPPWLIAFVSGTRSSAAVMSGECGPDDVAWAGLAGGRVALVLGRRGRPFRARERRQLAALAHIADHRRTDLEQLDPQALERQALATPGAT
ncbi:MAG TPA: ACT domain-containing protein [Acidimicrobiales bacterium]|nr:ACT domain-containing protein [Acidimicrobiales bacterium]